MQIIVTTTDCAFLYEGDSSFTFVASKRESKQIQDGEYSCSEYENIFITYIYQNQSQIVFPLLVYVMDNVDNWSFYRITGHSIE